ncbi:MAG: type 2 isopentenyl-diphosphate Delta-isomerase [Legionellaceae bacterium]|nr:type 2 isopentenyl-diphosphate Delta-isomerase [Legionellaceae bacterium]
MATDFQQFEQRKRDHIELALLPENQASECHDLDALTFSHEALPDLDLSAVSLTSERFGVQVSHPFMVSSMTAGHGNAAPINRHLLAACARQGWAMGVGSQRRELTDPDAAAEWRDLRRDYPAVPLFSNLGIAQLITTPLATIQRLVDALQAQALIIHCNPLQESIQPEGTPQFKGCWEALERLLHQTPVPVIVKETGCGFNAQNMQRLANIGVAAIDISGLGGTHWGRIEGHRATVQSVHQQAAHTFRNWGMTTLSSLLQARDSQLSCELWGSGGVRHGLDAAKLIALGASTIGFAKPMLEAALVSAEAVVLKMQQIEYELRVAMFCTGSACLSQLQEKICL